MDATNLADLYHLPLLDWTRIAARLDAGGDQVPGAGGPDRHTCWLTTLNPDGSPQTSVVWVGRDGDDLLFNTAEGRLKEAYDWQAQRLGEPTEYTQLGSLHPELVYERLRLYKVVDQLESGLTDTEAVP